MNLNQSGEMNTKYRHGMCKTKIYYIWKTMRQRCNNPNNSHYQWYGACGISVCKEWNEDFLNFYEWALKNGYKEGENLSIERKDSKKDYCPENCTWIKMSLQAKNTRKNVFITVDGITKIQSDWAKIAGIDNSALSKLRKNGIDVAQVIREELAYRQKPEEVCKHE